MTTKSGTAAQTSGGKNRMRNGRIAQVEERAGGAAGAGTEAEVLAEIEVVALAAAVMCAGVEISLIFARARTAADRRELWSAGSKRKGLASSRRTAVAKTCLCT